MKNDQYVWNHGLLKVMESTQQTEEAMMEAWAKEKGFSSPVPFYRANIRNYKKKWGAVDVAASN